MTSQVFVRRTAGLVVALGLSAGLYAAPAFAEPGSTDTSDSGPSRATGATAGPTSGTTDPVDTSRSGSSNSGALDIDTVMEQVQNQRAATLDQQIEDQMQDILNKQSLIRQSQDPDERAELASELQLDLIRLQSMTAKRNEAVEMFSNSASDFDRIVGRL